MGGKEKTSEKDFARQTTQHKPKTNRRAACRTKKTPPKLTIHAVPHAPSDAIAANANDENVHTQDQDGPVQRFFSVQFVILLFAMAATFGNELNRLHHLGTDQTGHHTKIGCAMQRTQQQGHRQKGAPHKVRRHFNQKKKITWHSHSQQWTLTDANKSKNDGERFTSVGAGGKRTVTNRGHNCGDEKDGRRHFPI
jgi:Uri superfamily endonuclease